MDNLIKEVKSFSSSLSFKLAVIFFLVLILMIPASLIRELIREREGLKQQTETEIQENWGRSQTISGPVLTIPYYRKELTSEKETVKKLSYLYILPEALEICGELIPEIRYRSIYKVPVYSSKLKINGSYMPDKDIIANIGRDNILWHKARMEMAVSDLRGIQEAVNISFNNSPVNAEPGLSAGSPFESGFHTSVKLTGKDAEKISDFLVEIDLRGSNSINFTPMGKTTTVKLHSDWTEPSFGGAFLPMEREVNSEGFRASWKVLHFNRNYPQTWKNKKYNTSDSVFGVSLLLPVNEYRKTERSVKYALLFLTLTFTLFFFIEILNKKSVPAVQYLMVGASLIIFYVLLLSLAEQLGFTIAYIIAATAIILQISVFIYKIVNSLKTALITAGILSLLYVYLFVLLQLQEYALLMGSTGLFVILSIIM